MGKKRTCISQAATAVDGFQNLMVVEGAIKPFKVLLNRRSGRRLRGNLLEGACRDRWNVPLATVWHWITRTTVPIYADLPFARRSARLQISAGGARAKRP